MSRRAQAAALTAGFPVTGGLPRPDGNGDWSRLESAELLTKLVFDVAEGLGHRTMRELARKLHAMREPLFQILSFSTSLHHDTTAEEPKGSIASRI